MRVAIAVWLVLLQLVLAHAHGAGFPSAYAPVVIQPGGAPERAEFDLTPLLERARRENKSLYVYLGAHDCGYCRRYEAFLDKNARQLVPHFAAQYIVADLRSSLRVPAKDVHFKVGSKSLPYIEFQKSIGDQRTRALVYPNVWLLDVNGKPLMQMPTGAGTFQTVPEQLEILRLEQ